MNSGFRGAKKQGQLYKMQTPAPGRSFTATMATDEKLGQTAGLWGEGYLCSLDRLGWSPTSATDLWPGTIYFPFSRLSFLTEKWL